MHSDIIHISWIYFANRPKFRFGYNMPESTLNKLVQKWQCYIGSTASMYKYYLEISKYLLPGFGSHEKQYKWLGTSQAQPGYVFFSQTPPKSWFSSNIVTWHMFPNSVFRRTAAQIPENLKIISRACKNI